MFDPGRASNTQSENAAGPSARIGKQGAINVLERGRSVGGTLRPSRERSVEDTATLLERLARLRAEEVINAPEFEDLKGESHGLQRSYCSPEQIPSL